MRRSIPLLLTLLALTTAWTAVPVARAYAQDKGGEDDDAKKKKSKEEWELRQAPLPRQQNAGNCPFVKILYDAARYEEFKDNKEASANVGYTGEMDGVTSTCSYKGAEPIVVKLRVTFNLGRGPQADSDHKTYRYWVAVTQRNRAVLAKQYFDLPVDFPRGQDRMKGTDEIDGIVIPRADAKVSGDNFEVLVGFDVTPEMADFNQQGKRFRLEAGAPVAETKTASR